MTAQVDVVPTVIRWARERSGRDYSDLLDRFPKLDRWEQGRAQPTLKELSDFAEKTYTPVGMLFLNEPPNEELPVSDFRTIGGRSIATPSVDLLETIYACQERQNWYREYAVESDLEPVALVGLFTHEDNPIQSAARLRDELEYNLNQRNYPVTWDNAFRDLVRKAESFGILVMVSGIVRANTRRALKPSEFRGFALSDQYAPVVFVNGVDTKAAQIFTLAHEIAHLTLGESGVSNSRADRAANLDRQPPTSNATSERWCNEVAAEFLVPINDIREQFNAANELMPEVTRLARRYKTSTLVILRRLFDARFLNWDNFQEYYQLELARVMALKRAKQSSGGDPYKNISARSSRRFTADIVSDTLEGRTLYRDAFRMLGIKTQSTFDTLTERLR